MTILLAVVLLVIFIAVINSAIYALTKSYIYTDATTAPEASVVLIPGAAVLRDGTPSPIFLDRVDTALLLYKAKKVEKILVSGDNSSEYYNEVDPVREYLLAAGVADEDIFLDYAGFDTYSSMYRARDIFGVTDVIISTQAFHLPRAVYIARELGLEAWGIETSNQNVLLKNYTREFLATEKAILDLWTKRKPKFLGETVSMETPQVIAEEPTECNADAKICADGSSVGRVGVACEFAACPKPDVTSGTVTTYLGGNGTALTVTVAPQEIISDSRCPKEVDCIWAGTVSVRTVLSTPVSHGEHAMKLNVPQVFGQYTVTLTNVTPEKTQDTIPVSSYRFTFEIVKS